MDNFICINVWQLILSRDKTYLIVLLIILMGIISNFIKGLKKSFSGRDYLREINQCNKCGKPSFFKSCLKCETEEAYRGWGKNN